MSDEKCTTEMCDLPATQKVYWPGKPKPLLYCDECTQKAKGVLGALGMEVAVEPLIEVKP